MCIYLNDVIEQDHRFVKKKVRASQCFKSFHTEERTLEGIEAMNTMRKGRVKVSRAVKKNSSPITDTRAAARRISGALEAIPGRHFWAIGYGAWSTGNITEEAVQEYLEHRHPSNRENDPFGVYFNILGSQKFFATLPVGRHLRRGSVDL